MVFKTESSKLYPSISNAIPPTRTITDIMYFVFCFIFKLSPHKLLVYFGIQDTIQCAVFEDVAFRTLQKQFIV